MKRSSRVKRVDKSIVDKISKTIKFLDFMVMTIFVSTFIFVITGIIIAYLKDWEELMLLLTTKWFDIMVKELMLMMIIQVTKLITQFLTKWIELKLDTKLEEESEEGANGL